jgi:steroid delta-isomerase-like uncharacterized protein
MNRFLGVALALCFVLLMYSDAQNIDGKQSARHVALARRVFTEIYGDGNLNLVDQLYADDFVDDSPGGGQGRDLVKKAVSEFHKAFPDLRIEIEEAFSAEDKVVLRYAARGTQTGAYYGIPPSRKSVSIRGITIFQIANERIKTEWTEYDRLGVLRQIGGIP